MSSLNIDELTDTVNATIYELAEEPVEAIHVAAVLSFVAGWLESHEPDESVPLLAKNLRDTIARWREGR
jgi:hypothetical protein